MASSTALKHAQFLERCPDAQAAWLPRFWWVSLVSRKVVCEHHWDGHLAIVEIDDAGGLINNVHFLTLRLTNHLSLSLHLKKRWQRTQSRRAAQQGIFCLFAVVTRESSDCLFVSVASEHQGLKCHHHCPKELSPPPKNFPETNGGPTPPIIQSQQQ